LLIVTVTSLTFPLSATGVRTLFPILVPQPLWERANAIDSNGYVVSSIFGPALAGALVALFGAPAALLVTAALSAGAAVIALGLRDPSTRTEHRGLLGEAWRGLVYVARHPSLRSLAISISIANIGWGLFFIALPVLVLRRIGGDAASVGNLFALLGVTGFLAVFFMGRVSTRGRERAFLAGAMLGQAAAFAIALFAGGRAELIALAMLVLGLATGPFDVTLRVFPWARRSAGRSSRSRWMWRSAWPSSRRSSRRSSRSGSPGRTDRARDTCVTAHAPSHDRDMAGPRRARRRAWRS
jgi:predicted MFS family arabinose efflux permease